MARVAGLSGHMGVPMSCAGSRQWLLDVDRGPMVGPWCGLFELRGGHQNDVFVSRCSDELTADGETVRAPVQRQAIAGCPVMLNGSINATIYAARWPVMRGSSVSIIVPSGGGGVGTVGVSSRSKPPDHQLAMRRPHAWIHSTAERYWPAFRRRPCSAQNHVNGSTSSGPNGLPIRRSHQSRQNAANPNGMMRAA